MEQQHCPYRKRLLSPLQVRYQKKIDRPKEWARNEGNKRFEDGEGRRKSYRRVTPVTHASNKYSFSGQTQSEEQSEKEAWDSPNFDL